MINATPRLAIVTARYAALVIPTSGGHPPLPAGTSCQEMYHHRVDRKSVNHLRSFMFQPNTLHPERVGGER
jgi:hypothetical protein